MYTLFKKVGGGGSLPPRLPAWNVARGFTGALIALGVYVVSLLALRVTSAHILIRAVAKRF